MNETFTPDLTETAKKFVDYTFRDMARFCATHGWDDAREQTRERLLTDLSPAPLDYRRGMVVGRQLFYFSHAYRVTGDEAFCDCAHSLYEDLTGNFWDDVNGGWYFSLTADNGLSDATKDLYGHAFILFGLAHYLAIIGNDEALYWIRRTETVVWDRFELPGGWLAPAATQEWALHGENLEQNPHMHLLEAYLSIYRTTQDEAFLDSASRIMSVYDEFLRTPDRSRVLEHLDENGQPSGEKGTLIQPGHLYEWYWLVCEYADCAERTAIKSENAQLVVWGDSHCLDTEAGGMFDLVNSSATTLSDRKRIWPMTERIKALGTLLRDMPNEHGQEKLVDAIRFFLDHYCRPDGSWHEYLTRNLVPDSDFMPLSTPYHVAMAALEVERLLGGPGAFGMTNTRAPGFS